MKGHPERLTAIGQACTAVLRETLGETISWVIDRVENGRDHRSIKAQFAFP